jgi:pimeloyl-ACP methyl ester carboxylesterase
MTWRKGVGTIIGMAAHGFGPIAMGAILLLGAASAATALENQPGAASTCGNSPGYIVGTPEGPLCISVAISTAGGAGDTPLAVFADQRFESEAGVPARPDNRTSDLANLAARVSREIAAPVVAIGRPGFFGSTPLPVPRIATGMTATNIAHFSSRIEVTAVSLVLERVKADNALTGFHLVGIGNGGNLAATLAARREDISCVVIADASLSERDRLAETGALFVPAELKTANDPIAELAALTPRQNLRILTLSDPGDPDTPAAATDAFVRAVKARLVAIDRLSLPGPVAPDIIPRLARVAARDCMAGLLPQAIEAHLRAALVVPRPAPVTPPQLHVTRPSVPNFDETFAAIEPRLPGEPTAQPLLPAPHFSQTDLIFGTLADSVACSAMPFSVWVTSAGSPECIRYYYSETGGHGSRALVFLNGDFTYRGPDGLAAVDPDYARIGPSDLQHVAETRSRDYGGPMLYLARPGTLGSSGQELSVRHSPREVALIEAALDDIRRRHGIATFDLVGHSGGGLIVGGLVSERHDIGCAVTSSGVLAARAWSMEKLSADPASVSYLYDPIDHVKDIRPGPDFRYFILTDAQDATVSLASTRTYLDALTAAGIPFTHIALTAADDAHHDLALHGFRAAIACAHGRSDADIRAILTRTVITNRHMSEFGDLGDIQSDQPPRPPTAQPSNANIAP